MHDAILKNHPSADISVSVVWIDMLTTDSKLMAARSSRQFEDTRVQQFWDGKQAFGYEVGRSLNHPEHAAFDIYLFYDAQAVWEDSLPPPARWFIQMDPESWAQVADSTLLATGALTCGYDEIAAGLASVMDTLTQVTQ